MKMTGEKSLSSSLKYLFIFALVLQSVAIIGVSIAVVASTRGSNFSMTFGAESFTFVFPPEALSDPLIFVPLFLMFFCGAFLLYQLVMVFGELKKGRIFSRVILSKLSLITAAIFLESVFTGFYNTMIAFRFEKYLGSMPEYLNAKIIFPDSDTLILGLVLLIIRSIYKEALEHAEERELII